ncbi:MAG: hypothetical protein ACMVP2_15305 [Imperialibacter sp.]|uniref:hypothetical protein n=1 Tax=Imperialibacter sp. TaxID=2038411 RepID=UPI0030DC6651|tara:strand:- start:4107 stop:4832 length:726 start_codon:yes stop_codon:yes gene_type:complete
MKRLSYLVIILALTCTGISTAQAQNVDDILASYFEITGGLSNWKNLKSMKMTGKMLQGGLEFPAIMSQKYPNKFRMDIDIQGKKIIQAYDGKEGWMINPLAQITEPKVLTAEEVKEMEDNQMEDEFIDYKSKGHAVALDGEENIEGTDCFKVKLTKKSGDIEYHFFDKDNNVPIMVRTFAKTGPTEGQPVETFMSDYDAVGDFMLPFSMTTKFQGQTVMQIVVDSYDLNATLDDSVFALPK